MSGLYFVSFPFGVLRLHTRPNFEGDKDSPGGGRRRSPVTNTFQIYYPEHKRKV